MNTWYDIYKTYPLLHNNRVSKIYDLGDNVVKQVKFDSTKAYTPVPNELAVLQVINNLPFVVNYIDYHILNNGDLLLLMKKMKNNINYNLCNAELKLKHKIIVQTAIALHNLHIKYVVHADIKIDNLLFDNENNCYLSDFGMGHFTYIPKSLSGLYVQQYKPPELFNTTCENITHFLYKCDVWAYGILLLYLLNMDSNNHIFSKYKNIKVKYENELYESIVWNIQNPDIFRNKIHDITHDQELTDILLDIFKLNPSERPSMQQLLQTNWYNNIITKYNLVDSIMIKQELKLFDYTPDIKIIDKNYINYMKFLILNCDQSVLNNYTLDITVHIINYILPHIYSEHKNFNQYFKTALWLASNISEPQSFDPQIYKDLNLPMFVKKILTIIGKNIYVVTPYIYIVEYLNIQSYYIDELFKLVYLSGYLRTHNYKEVVKQIIQINDGLVNTQEIKNDLADAINTNVTTTIYEGQKLVDPDIWQLFTSLYSDK